MSGLLFLTRKPRVNPDNIEFARFFHSFEILVAWRMPGFEPEDLLPNPELTRSLNLSQAISLNVANMVGIGPFITIPMFIAAMGGPHAAIGWVVAAVVVVCDGLVWSELGAAMPGSGGSYHFLKQVYGGLFPKWGQLMPFLFIWQFLISGTLEMASGYAGTMPYVSYIFPDLESLLYRWKIPGGPNTVAAVAVLVVTLLLCRHIRILGWMSIALCVGTFLALFAVIFAGLTHFNPHLYTFPTDQFRWSNAGGLAKGLGAAMTLAVYDYLGYYNICHLGDEVRDPARTIPRAVNRSIWIVAILYLTMNISILGVIPWQEAMKSERIAADVMERVYGRPIAVAFTWLVVWAVVACMFSITLGYSRIPFAAARQGDFFSVFSRLHPRGQYPIVSLLTLGGLTAVCCYFPLQQVIDAAVAVRILIQFIGQTIGLHLLRTMRPDFPLPFRMRLYPLPSLVALAGWLFLLGTTDWKVLTVAVAVTASGVPVFFFWRALRVKKSEPESV
jgi:amino acid transporter